MYIIKTKIVSFAMMFTEFKCADCGNNLFYGFLNICIRFVPIKSALTVDEEVQLNSQIQLQPEG